MCSAYKVVNSDISKLYIKTSKNKSKRPAEYLLEKVKNPRHYFAGQRKEKKRDFLPCTILTVNGDKTR